MRLRSVVILATATIGIVAPVQTRAQLPMPQLGKRAAEIGYVHEWFHRDFGDALPAETDWSVASVAIGYGVQDWLSFQGQGGLSNVRGDGSYYDRLSIGAGVSIRAFQSGRWSISANARYIDTFDHDQWSTQFHKSMRTLSGSAQLGLTVVAWNQAGTLWAGPIASDDHSDLYFNDSREPIEASAGVGWGASAGARFVLFGWIAIYGYTTYIDDFAGGAGISLHASRGSF